MFFYQEYRQNLCQKFQQGHLALRPQSVGLALIKTHITPKNTLIHDCAMEHTLNTLWLENTPECLRLTGNHYEILLWQVVPVSAWQADNTLPVYTRQTALDYAENPEQLLRRMDN